MKTIDIAVYKRIKSAIYFILQVGVSVNCFSQTEKIIDNTGAGDFTSFTAAINYLNTSVPVPSNGLIFKVVAGQQFNENPPVITKVAGTETPVKFVKFGAGANPVIFNETALTDDGVIHFSGAAWIGFSGIDISDPNPSNSSRYITAYYVNNSNNIRIENCNISDFAVYGVYCRNATTNVLIYNNNLFHTTEYIDNETSVYGVYANYNASANNVVVSNNKIYGFKNLSSGVYGIRLNQINGSIINNFVSIVCDGNDKIYGIRVDGREGKIQNVYHNSVILDGNATDDGYALSVLGAAGTVNIKNNLFVNMRDTAVFDQLAVFVGFNGLTFNMDYNLYLSEDIFVGKWYQNYASHISDWISISGVDIHSVEAQPGFVDASACNLHILEANHGKFYLAGVAIENISTDIDGEQRDLTFPYKGADEGSISMNLHVEFSIDSLNFNQVIINELSDSIQLDLVHYDGATIFVDSIKTTGPFLIKTAGMSWTDFISGFSMNGLVNKLFKVAYLPSQQAIETGKVLAFMSNGQMLEIFLQGQGIVAGMAVEPDSLWFGQQLITEPGSPQLFFIKNTGDNILNIASVVANSGFSVRLGVNNPWLDQISGFAIPVGDSVMIDVRFNPDSVLNYKRFIVVHSSMDLFIPVYGFGMGTRFELIQSGFTGAWYGKTALGDYDADGDLDALVVSYGLSPGLGYSYFYKNNGNLNFEPVETGIIGVGNGMAMMVDFDNDGDLDVFVSGQRSYENNISLNESKFYKNENGIFVEKPCNIMPLGSGDAIWGDIDNDGDYDMFICGNLDVNSAYSLVYRNNGNFNFSLIQELDGVSNGMGRFADYNNDGYLDLALTGRRGSNDYVTLLYKNNNNEFIKINEGLQGARYSSLDWGDLDSDGDMDLIITGSIQNELPSFTKIYRNDGNDIFTDTEVLLAGIRQGDLDLGDLDQDGDLDIVMNGIYLNEVSWIGHIYLNNGNMQFVLADSITSLKYANMVLADMDNDNDLDIFITGRYDFQDYWCNIYQNTFPVVSQSPAIVEGFHVTAEGATALLGWNAVESANSLSFNVDIENVATGEKIMSGMSASNGYRMVPSRGNANSNNFLNLNYLPDGTYHIKVQTVNNAFQASEFNSGLEIVINANHAPVLAGQISDTTMYAGEELEISIANVFYDPDMFDVLYFALKLQDGTQAPDFSRIDWLSQTIIFQPDSSSFGTYPFIVSAIDRSGESVSVNFSLLVRPPLSMVKLDYPACRFYPNPACKFVQFETERLGKLQLVDMLGVTLMFRKIESCKNIIILEGFTPGLYQFVFTSIDGFKYVQKIVIR